MLQFALLAELNDCQFHSGERLAQKLGVTRAAIWKNLHILQEEFNIEIHSISGKGYRLPTPIELLDTQLIQHAIAKSAQGWEVETCFSIDSTNQYLLDKASKTAANRIVVFAEHQKAGRGRRGRHWVSPFGANLYGSFLYRLRQSAFGLMGLSLAVAVAVSRAIRDVTGLETQLKWPNDILYQEKKLCGILLEVHGEYTGPTAVIIGIGVNVRLTEQDKTAIGQACTALEEISHGAIARNALAVALARQVINVTLEFEQSGLSGVLEEWRRGDVFQNRPVTLSLGQNTIHGICRGIDEQGALLVEQEGQVHRYFSGEMTLRAG